MANAIIMATITDATGCITTNEIQISAEDDRCLDILGIQQLKVCHKTGNGCQSTCVDLLSIASHLAHGDYLGNCGNSCSLPASNPKTASSTTSSAVASSRTAPDEIAPDKIASDVSTQETDIAVEAYPNPFKAFIYVKLSNPEEKSITMSMFDLMGKNVPLKPLNKTPEGVDVLDTERLSGGLYFLQIKIGDYSKTIKLIKE